MKVYLNIIKNKFFLINVNKKVPAHSVGLKPSIDKKRDTLVHKECTREKKSNTKIARV